MWTAIRGGGGGVRYRPVPAARPILRATEQRAGRGPGAPRKSSLGPLFGGPRYRPTPVRAGRRGRAIEGHGAAC